MLGNLHFAIERLQQIEKLASSTKINLSIAGRHFCHCAKWPANNVESMRVGRGGGS